MQVMQASLFPASRGCERKEDARGTSRVELQTSSLDVTPRLHRQADACRQSRLPGSDKALSDDCVLVQTGVANLYTQLSVPRFDPVPSRLKLTFSIALPYTPNAVPSLSPAPNSTAPALAAREMA